MQMQQQQFKTFMPSILSNQLELYVAGMIVVPGRMPHDSVDKSLGG